MFASRWSYGIFPPGSHTRYRMNSHTLTVKQAQTVESVAKTTSAVRCGYQLFDRVGFTQKLTLVVPFQTNATHLVHYLSGLNHPHKETVSYLFGQGH